MISCNNRNNSVTEKISSLKVDTLSFSSRGFNSAHQLKLTTDNQFIDENYWAGCLGGGGTQKIYGTYSTDNGKIILNPKTVHYIETPMFESDTLMEKRISKYNPDSLKIKTDFYLVEWRRNKYLLSESMDPNYEMDSSYLEKNDFIRFAQYYNSESRRFKFDGFLYIENEQTSDSLNPDFDYEQIPVEWRKYFLKKPIVTEIKRIIKIEFIKLEYAEGFFCQIELNKGTEDGVYKGLYFRNKTSRLTLFIDSTAQNKSYSTIYVSKKENANELIGTEFRTKWE